MNQPSTRQHTLPRFAAAVLRILLPVAERNEVLDDLDQEFALRRERAGGIAARFWLWRQVLASVPALVGRGWWRGWSGFAPEADRWQPGGGTENWGRVVRFSLRRLRLRPRYTVLTVATLALGVAGVTAAYTVTRPLLFKPLPFAEEGEVRAFWMPNAWSEAEFEHIRPSVTGFQSLAAYRRADVTLRRGDGPALLAPGISASAELFRVLGADPERGSAFREGDDRMGAEPVAVIAHSLWTELGSPEDIVGQRLEISGAMQTVVGVMPEGFWFPDPGVQVWLPEPMDPGNRSGNYALIGRIAPGATAAAVDAEVNRIVSLLDQAFTYPEQWDLTRNASVVPVREFLVGEIRPALIAALGTMVLLLLIACVNVAALMIGQMESRGTELALRRAIGAERGDLIRQVWIESLLIGLFAALLGIAGAIAIVPLLIQTLPLGELGATAGIDWRVGLVATAIALFAATAVAISAFAMVGGPSTAEGLRGSRTGGIVGRGGRLESGLVVGQVALVILLAAGSGLLARSVAKLRLIDPGIQTEGRAVIDLVTPATLENARVPILFDEMLRQLREMPGVQNAAVTQTLPLRWGGNNWGINVEGHPELDGTTTFMRIATVDYLPAMGVRLIDGRGFTDGDRLAGEETPVIINQALASEYFPGENPIGRRISYGEGWDRIIGVVDNVAEAGLTDPTEPARYYLYGAVSNLIPIHTVVLELAPGADAAGVLTAARGRIQDVAPEIAIQQTTTLDDVYDSAIGPAGQLLTLLLFLAGLALLLGVIGVYGVVAHYVARRRRDWGIRLALGLPPGRVVLLNVARGGAMVGGGIVLGAIAFFMLSRVLASFLYEVSATDGISLAAASAVVMTAGLAAAYLPSRQASRIDPALALRQE